MTHSTARSGAQRQRVAHTPAITSVSTMMIVSGTISACTISTCRMTFTTTLPTSPAIINARSVERRVCSCVSAAVSSVLMKLLLLDRPVAMAYIVLA
jgi:hypothetical protein